MKVGERGQVTIPKRLRDRYGIRKNADVDFVDDGTSIRIVKRSEGTERMEGLYGIIKLKHARTVDEYIEDVRGR